MAKFILNIHSSNPNKCKEVPLSCVFAFVSLTTLSFFLSQTSASDCVLNIHQSSPWNDSICEAGNWGGFVNNCKCGAAFDDYLYALAQRANHANDQKLFLNVTEQKNCFLLMKSIDKDISASGCGFEKLTSGFGGCSDFSTNDVIANLGNTFHDLEEDCKLLGSAGKLDTKTCSVCLKRWEDIVALDGNGTESKKAETMVCSFAILVSLTGSKAKDKNWIQALYRCLGDQTFSKGKYFERSVY